MSTRRTPSVLVMAKAPRPGTVRTRHPQDGTLVPTCVQRGQNLGQGLSSAVVEAIADGAGPLDGGYYLIGMGRPHTGLFGLDAAPWSTDQVLAANRALAPDEGLSVELLRPLRDLDTPEDAAALLGDRMTPSRIGALLRPTEDAV